MVFVDRIKSKRRQVAAATEMVHEYWPTTGRMTNGRKYFQAWTIKEVVTPSGKIRTKRVYSGPYFSPKMTSHARTTRKFLSLFLSLLCCVLLYFGAFFSDAAGNCWYIYIPHALCCLGCILLVLFAASQAATGKRLMLNELREASTRFMPCALFVSVMFALTSILTLIHTIVFDFPPNALISIACLLAAFICATVIFSIEYCTDYVHVMNENAPLAMNP